MNKIVLKTALKTICLLIVVGAAVFGIWFLGFPQSMASVCEKTGNYSFAVICASMRYKNTGEASDLSRCAEDAILSGNDKYIVEYGEKLIAHKEFDSVCELKNEQFSSGSYAEYTTDYKVYICGNVASAQYRTGDLDKAVTTALGSGNVKSFNKLVLEIASSGNAQDAQTILTALDGITAQESQYLENLKAILINIGV